ncbi:unnamed protein product, partial [Nesidiocoris tenuis]
MKSPLGQLTWICDGEGRQGGSKRTINHATGNGGQQKKSKNGGKHQHVHLLLLQLLRWFILVLGVLQSVVAG